MKIVILSAFLSPHRSGAEACVEEVALRLCDEFDITIVAARGFSGGGMLGGKVPVIRVGAGLKIDKWLFPFLAPFVVLRLRPDIIHAVLETFAGLALHLCKFTAPEAKRVLTLQTTNRSLLKGMVIRSPDKVTAISSALVRIADGFGREDVVLIPNGLDVSSFEFQVSCRKYPGSILFVGRLEKMKGVDTLLRAFAEVRQSMPQSAGMRLRVVGGGSQRKNLERLARKLGIANRVMFAGRVAPSAVYKEYALAEIFCCLSRSEAFGNVFIEAQAAGCAVIGTRVGGVSDIVRDGATGLLVEPDDASGAADAIKTLLVDDALRKRLVDEGRKNALEYDWDFIAGRYEDVYHCVHGHSGYR